MMQALENHLILSKFTVSELVDELRDRGGVKAIVITAANMYGSVERRGMGSEWVERTPVVSPATILVIKRD